jgi:putative membrane protein
MKNAELGKLAVQRASATDIRQFGQKLWDEQTKTNDRLKELASQKNISVPGELDAKHQSQLDKLAKLSGPDFDKAFLKQQLKDQENQVRDFSDEAQAGTDPNIKTFAASTLPNLQQLLGVARNLNKSAKKAKAQ